MIVRIEFEEALLSSSSTWWSIRVPASQLSIKLSETVNARGPSFEEVPAEPDVVAIVVGCKLGWVATVGRLTAGSRDATVGRLTTKKGFRLIPWVGLLPEVGMLPEVG